MFVNTETAVLRALVNADADRLWHPMATRFLSTYERNLAVGKIASAIQEQVSQHQTPSDPLVADLYAHALRRVDFYSIALELIQAAEHADPRRFSDRQETVPA